MLIWMKEKIVVTVFMDRFWNTSIIIIMTNKNVIFMNEIHFDMLFNGWVQADKISYMSHINTYGKKCICPDLKMRIFLREHLMKIGSNKSKCMNSKHGQWELAFSRYSPQSYFSHIIIMVFGIQKFTWFQYKKHQKNYNFDEFLYTFIGRQAHIQTLTHIMAHSCSINPCDI